MAAASAPASHPAAFAALRHPSFRPFLGAEVLAMMADNVEHVISYWVIFQVFQSPALAGFAVIAHWTPFLLLGVHFGALADRFDCRRLIQLAMLAFIASSLGWAVLFLTGTLQVWHAVVLLVVHGIAGAMWGPAGQLLIHDIVGRDHLQSAVRMAATGRQVGMLLGPAVGGGLLLVLGPGWGLVANVLIYLPLIVLLFVLPYTGHQRTGALAQRPLAAGEALRTLRALAPYRGIVVMVALGGLSSLFVGNAYQAQMPQFASAFTREQGEVAYTVLLAASAGGAVVGGITLEAMAFFRHPRVRTAVLMALAWSIAIAVFALVPVYAVAVGALFLAGLLSLGFVSMAQTLVQLEAPPAERGRAVGLFSMSANGLRVGSGVTVGLLGAAIGIHASLALSALAFLACGIALFAYANGRARRLAAA